MIAITNCKRYMILLILSYLAYILKSIDFCFHPAHFGWEH